MSNPHIAIDSAEFAREWEGWHREHERRRADPHGFLAVTGLYWLDGSSLSVPGVPGRWRTGTGGPVVELRAGERLELDGEELTGDHEFGPLSERAGVTVGFEQGVLEIARRGGRDILRPRRPDHPFLAAYSGTPTYLPNPRWRAAARFVAFEEPRATEVGAAVEGLSHVYEAPGHLEFELRRETFRLTAFPGRDKGSFTVLFTDATSGVTTYTSNRALSVPAPDGDGGTVVDFNRAVNLPCAYTDFATCPLPPAENRLPIGIEAGEKTPLERVEGRSVPEGIVTVDRTAS